MKPLILAFLFVGFIACGSPEDESLSPYCYAGEDCPEGCGWYLGFWQCPDDALPTSSVNTQPQEDL